MQRAGTGFDKVNALKLCLQYFFFYFLNVRQRGRLQHQPSNAGDSGPTDLRCFIFITHFYYSRKFLFLKKNFGRKRSGGDQQQQQQQRRLRRAPSARGNSKAEAYQMAVKHK